MNGRNPPVQVGSNAKLGPLPERVEIALADLLEAQFALGRLAERTGRASPTQCQPAADALKKACGELMALISQRDSLRAALVKVLDTRNREAKAAMSYQTARENFSDSADERKANERAMLAASDAEREARVLLTLKA